MLQIVRYTKTNTHHKMQESLLLKYFHVFFFLASCSTALSCHGTIRASGITADEKKIIVQEHNRLRQLVATGGFPGQPGAENMQEMIWDNELAVRAQEWANNCQFRHDPNRTVKRFTMGQNLAVIWSTALLEPDDGDFPSRINNWFNEVQKYSFGASWSPKTGHYSQLVWGATNLIGCGYSEYEDKAKYNKLYVCNYGPGGNVVGLNPYVIGKPSCKSYGMDASPRYRGLCKDPTLKISSGSFFNKIETYEYKQNTFNKNTSYTSSRFNIEKLQQANTHLQLSDLAKKTTTATALISTFFHQKSIQSKPIFSSSQFQQEEKNNLSFTKNQISDESLLRSIIYSNTQSTEDIPSQRQLEQQEHQQQQLQAKILNPNPSEIASGPQNADWSLLSWVG